MRFMVERWKRTLKYGKHVDVWEPIGEYNILYGTHEHLLVVCHVDHTVGFNVSPFDVKITTDYLYFDGTIKVDDHKHELFKIRCKN